MRNSETNGCGKQAGVGVWASVGITADGGGGQAVGDWIENEAWL